jgi:hypothetical protein
MKEQSPINYKNFSLTRGGLLFQLLVRLRFMKPKLEPLYHRAN